MTTPNPLQHQSPINGTAPTGGDKTESVRVRPQAMEDAEAKVRELFDEVLRRRSIRAAAVEVTALSSGGGNYTSALFAATATADARAPAGVGAVLSIFAKVAIIGDKMRQVMDADTMFTTESIVYSELASEYEKLQKRFKTKIFDFPEMFACDMTRGSETLLLEDLTKRGFSTPSRHSSAEWRFAAAAITKLAAFHALSLAFEKHEPAKFMEIADRLASKDRNENDSSNEFWAKIVASSVQVVKEEHRERLIKVLSVSKQEFMKFKKPINKVVLGHGDYRTSNLLSKDQGENVEIMVVDYQTVHTGSPAADVLYFIFLGTDQEFRKKHFQPLLDLYYQELASNAESMAVDASLVYPREVFDSEIKEMMPNALRISTFILPIVTVDEAKAPQTSGEADVSQFHITPNQLFAERFRGLVSDCVDWGAL